MKIVHLRDQYIGVSFVYFLLKGFNRFEHFIACRETIKRDLILYPFSNILITSNYFLPFYILDKIFTVIFKLKVRLINDWQSYYFLINKIKFDVIHAHMGMQGYYAIELSKKLNVPLVVTFYGSDMSDVALIPGWKFRYILLFEHVSVVIVEGKHMANEMVKLGCPSEKIRVVRIGIPLENITFNTRNSFFHGDTLKVLMCSNFYPKKGFFTALKTFKKLVNNSVKLDVVIIGEGPLKNEISSMITDFELIEVVKLVGTKSLKEIYKISKEFHLFFHPSETASDGGSEGGAPTIILEMQALGLPIISTYHADIPNIIPELNHFLAKERDVDGLVNQFNLLIEMPNWDNISRRGREFVINEHSNKVCSSLVEDIYYSLV